jgi:hypothetical protein
VVLDKYPVLNNMTLFRNGRVLVVHCLADWRRTPNCKQPLRF